MHHIPIEQIASAEAGVTAVLHGTDIPETAIIPEVLHDAYEHAAAAHTLLAKGLGELAAYTGGLITTPHAPGSPKDTTPVTTSVTECSVQPTVESRPESTPHTIPQPEYALEFSPEEFQALIADARTFKAIEAGKIYEIPGHPDKILRIIPMSRCTGNKLYTPEQNREHMRKYEAELARLQACGVRILRRATYIDDNPIRSKSMLYTVVERHPDGTNFLDLASSVTGDPYMTGTLYPYRHIIKGLMDSLNAYWREASAVSIGDLRSIDQYATDGTLLDYDPYLENAQKDRGTDNWWGHLIRDVSNVPGNLYDESQTERSGNYENRTPGSPNKSTNTKTEQTDINLSGIDLQCLFRKD